MAEIPNHESIRALNEILNATRPEIEGTWAIELDEEGYEIAVLRGEDGRPSAWMNPDDYRALAKEPP